MFPATLSHSGNAHVRRILIVSLAALLLFTALAVAPGVTPEARAAHPVDYIITFANDAETGPGPVVTGTGSQDALTVTVEGETIDNIHASCSDLFNLYTKQGDTYIRNNPLPSNWGYGESGNPTAPQRRIWDFRFTIHLPSGDKVCGGTPPPPEPGTIIVEKQTDPDGDPTSFTFTGDAAGSLGDGGQIVVSGLDAGTYSSTETVPAGWTLTSIVCDDGASGDLGTATATFNVGAGETLKCVFTNTKNPPEPGPAIDIEKATNGEDADTPTGPVITVGDPVTWTYVVANTGDVALTDVKVTDDQLGDVCTIGDLAVGASDQCELSGIATLGQYANLGTVTASYEETRVTDEDPSHYLGVETPEPPNPAIDIEKATNGEDADTPTGPVITVGDPVTWTYVVANTGDVALTDVKVTDDQLGDVCTIGDLAVGASQTCTMTGTAVLDQYANVGTVVGTYLETQVTDTDPSHYAGIAVAGTAQLGDTVWHDKDKDGVQDADEPGINGATVILKDADGNEIDRTVTANNSPDGWYGFVGLEAGTYTATLDLTSVKSTYKLSTAGAFTVTLEEGDEYLDADFGLYEEEELPKTGVEAEGLMLLALGLLMIGTIAVVSSRRRRIEAR